MYTNINLVTITGVIILIFIYIIYQCFHYDEIGIDIEYYVNNAKTGDLILFHNPANPFILFTNYWSHVGIVYVDNDNGNKYLIEANQTKYITNIKKESGIFVTDLKNRLTKRIECARIYVKQLNKNIDNYTNLKFYHFIKYARNNLTYNTNIIKNVYNKCLGEKCNKKTNCCEFIFLCLINLGLLKIEDYDKSIINYFYYISRLSKLNNGYSYNNIKPINVYIDIIDI